MNIIERTQYSADGGKTWSDTEREAMAERVHQNLMEVMSTREADDILSIIENAPDALITALRDMGALPEESSPDALFRLVRAGSFALYDTRYAVVPIEDYQRAAAALTEMDGAIVSGAITAADGVYAVVPMDQHENGREAIKQVKAFARGVTSMSQSRAWCCKRGINWEDN